MFVPEKVTHGIHEQNSRYGQGRFDSKVQREPITWPVNDEITYYNFCPIFLINMTG